jgi:hypothetical protein
MVTESNRAESGMGSFKSPLYIQLQWSGLTGSLTSTSLTSWCNWWGLSIAEPFYLQFPYNHFLIYLTQYLYLKVLSTHFHLRVCSSLQRIFPSESLKTLRTESERELSSAEGYVSEDVLWCRGLLSISSDDVFVGLWVPKLLDLACTQRNKPIRARTKRELCLAKRKVFDLSEA